MRKRQSPLTRGLLGLLALAWLMLVAQPCLMAAPAQGGVQPAALAHCLDLPPGECCRSDGTCAVVQAAESHGEVKVGPAAKLLACLRPTAFRLLPASWTAIRPPPLCPFPPLPPSPVLEHRVLLI
ncbi:MAG: hypothetical protein M3Z21_14335 [Pseudomonadota bacterium]|nr:hypothetical protein [Pseudomonadota bacterium]